MIEGLAEGITATNESQQITAVGAPDFVINKGVIVIGYIEAKDVGTMTVNKIPSSKDSKKFWEEINKQKEKSRIQLAKLPFEKKIEILEQMQRDWQELMNSNSPKISKRIN